MALCRIAGLAQQPANIMSLVSQAWRNNNKRSQVEILLSTGPHGLLPLFSFTRQGGAKIVMTMLVKEVNPSGRHATQHTLVSKYVATNSHVRRHPTLSFSDVANTNRLTLWSSLTNMHTHAHTHTSYASTHTHTLAFVVGFVLASRSVCPHWCYFCLQAKEGILCKAGPSFHTSLSQSVLFYKVISLISLQTSHYGKFVAAWCDPQHS